MKQLFTFYVSLIFLQFLFVPGSVFSQISVEADIVVAFDGSGDFTTIQAAINAVPSTSERRTVIFIKRGLYDQEKLIIPAEKKNVTFIGESREETIISYHIYDCSSNGKCPAEDAALWTGDNIRTSATLSIHGDGFRAENLTIQNTAGPAGQAQAITVRADKCVFINVDLKGYQDTMYFWSEGNRSYFEGCLVVGRTDYIYGGGIVYFQDCEIRSWGGGWITAPSTLQNQAYGFVFNECDITYALNSPRAGDDGNLVRFGRPWHNYPKVAWLNCNMTEMIHPEGWGDTWSMSYAATSQELHLYEYNNTGSGADMSGRANWAGIKALTEEEAQNYTVQAVLSGNDGWDPTAEAPLVQQYNWDGGGVTDSWLEAGNWNPDSIPANGESANVSGNVIIKADGGSFEADLSLTDSATLEIASNSSATYISANGATITTTSDVSLSGKVATKDSIVFDISGNLTLDASLIGVHKLIKKGNGSLKLNTDNSNFSGDIEVKQGSLEGVVDNSLGKGAVSIYGGATLIVENNNAFYAKSKLSVVSGASLVLNGDITTSEFFIDNTMQDIGEYSTTTHPALISGSGKIIVGRPSVFTFIGGENGNWDNPDHYIPAMVPQAGETVICDKEMETTSAVFEADIRLTGAGSMRLRGVHQCTGTIYMENGTSFRYNTGGTGFTLDAPIVVEGDVMFVMESGNAAGSTMSLGGPISGSSKITVLNNGKGTPNTGTVILGGDNSGFSGTWDLTVYSQKYSGNAGYISLIEGNCANAFGKGLIDVGLYNKVIFSKIKAGGDTLQMNIGTNARVVLNEIVHVNKLTLNSQDIAYGTYSAATNPETYEGSGTLTVSQWPTAIEDQIKAERIKIYDDAIHVLGIKSKVSIYNMLGNKVLTKINQSKIALNNLPQGIYIVSYEVEGNNGRIKFSK